MQDTHFVSAVCVDDQGRTHTFRYSVLAEQIPAARLSFACYGIQAEEEGGACICIPNLTHSLTHIEHLLGLLEQYAVSPTHLFDVVDDWANENHLPRPKPQQVAEMR